jgi:hypothetical protein
MKGACREVVLEGMRTTLITLTAALTFLGIALASALPASAQPPCAGGAGINFGGSSSAKELYVRSCRAPLPGGKMREYGFIRIGPRATTATDCVLKIRTGVELDGNEIGLTRPEWGSCRPALRTGRDLLMTGEDVPVRRDHRPQFTEFCYELQKGGRRMSGFCVRSQSH